MPDKLPTPVNIGTSFQRRQLATLTDIIITELERLSFMRQGYIRPGKTIPREIMHKRREIRRCNRG